MADAFSDWYVHRVDVETLTSRSDDGTQTTTPHQGVACWVEEGTKMVRGGDGSTVASSARLHVALGVAELFPPGSLVSWRGKSSQVLSRDISDSVVGDELDGATITLE